MIAIMALLICVALPVAGGLGFAAWKELLKSRPPDPFAILAGRYAKGEIDEVEYTRRLQVLSTPEPIQLPPGYTD
jgi:uncharacterized membrane protein